MYIQVIRSNLEIRKIQIFNELQAVILYDTSFDVLIRKDRLNSYIDIHDSLCRSSEGSSRNNLKGMSEADMKYLETSLFSIMTSQEVSSGYLISHYDHMKLTRQSSETQNAPILSFGL